MARGLGIAALLLLSLVPLRARAEEPAPTPTPRFVRGLLPPENRLVIGDLTVARFNPVGLETQVRAGWVRRLYQAEFALTRDNFFFLGVAPKFNPAYLRAGPVVELQPLSILNFRAGVEHVRFFSTFGFLQSFPTPRADYSDSRLDERSEELDANYAASGTHAYFEPTFQIKIGNIVVRNKFAAEYWDMDLREGDTVFYEATLDTLLPDEGFNLANDFDVLYATDYGLAAGLRHSFVRPVYEGDHYLPGEEHGYIRNRHHRLGVLAAYTFYDHGYTRFNKPTIVVISSWYLSHRWRTGEEVSQAVPYFVLGFGFQTDLLDY